MSIRTLTVKELREALANYPDDLAVIVGSDYGDRSHTIQAVPVGGLNTVNITKEYGYSNTGWKIVKDNDSDCDPWADDDDDDDNDNETLEALSLNNINY